MYPSLRPNNSLVERSGRDQNEVLTLVDIQGMKNQTSGQCQARTSVTLESIQPLSLRVEVCRRGQEEIARELGQAKGKVTSKAVIVHRLGGFMLMTSYQEQNGWIGDEITRSNIECR